MFLLVVQELVNKAKKESKYMMFDMHIAIIYGSYFCCFSYYKEMLKSAPSI